MEYSFVELWNYVFVIFRVKERNMNSFESVRGFMLVI